MPASSKTDPLLAKADPISNGGSASGITYRRGKKPAQQQLQPERGVRICERNSPEDTKVRGGGAPGAGAELHLQPVEQTMVRQAVSAAHGGPQRSRFHL